MSTTFPRFEVSQIQPLAQRLAYEVPMTNKGLVLQSRTIPGERLFDIANELQSAYANVHGKWNSTHKYMMNPDTTGQNILHRVGLVLAEHPLTKKTLELFSKRLPDKEAAQKLRDMASSDLLHTPKVDIEI